jgi:sugar O-acyltransferase (sialic acid O-acetyltransferase NeuD family)
MKKVIIIGSGGHGAELDDYIRFSNRNPDTEKIDVIGFIDDNPENYNAYKFSSPLLGSIINHRIFKDALYIIGIANLNHRRTIAESFKNAGASFMTFIHPTAMVSPSSTMGEGNVIAPLVNIGPNVSIGNFNLLNARTSLGHDTSLGDFNFISPNCSFSGHTTIGDENLFGINSATIPKITIGNRNKIMAGMVADKSLGNDSTLFYRYKEKIIAYPK